MAWLNGHNLGRYWLIDTNCKGQSHSFPDISMEWDNLYCNHKLPLQRYYFSPNDWLIQTNNNNNNNNHSLNYLVLMEEIGFHNINGISLTFCQTL